MPSPIAFNALGHPIAEIDKTIALKNAWLRDLSFPKDKELLERLSPDDFRSWIYGLPPMEALLLASYSKDIKKIQNRKRNVLCRMFDFLWRVRHGYA